MEEAAEADNSKDMTLSTSGQQIQNQQQPLMPKRKHRRGKPKPKNGGNKSYKKSNWKFQIPRQHLANFNKRNNVCPGGGGDGSGSGGNGRRKLLRSRSLLVPYNTNKFLMEEHMPELPNALLTPNGRTRDSSFSVDSDDNYFFSLPEDEEEFLTKEFANVYERARVERLESMTKEQLIKECVQIEDRYTKDQGTQRQQRISVQRVSVEYASKIRALEEKVKELSRENYNLRCQLIRSATLTAAAAASPPSAAAPTGAAFEQPTPMESSSEDSESDSSSSTSSSTSSSSSEQSENEDCVNVSRNVVNGNADCINRRRRSCSSRSSVDDVHNGSAGSQLIALNENADCDLDIIPEDRCRLLDAQMDEDLNPDQPSNEVQSTQSGHVQ